MPTVSEKKENLLTKNLIPIILSVVVIGLAIFSFIEFRQISSYKLKTKDLEAKITSLEQNKQDLTAKNTEFTTKNTELTASLDTALADVNAKKADLDKINTDLAAKQAELAKAQRGVAKLSELDTLFKTFETNATTAGNLSSEGFTAYDNEDYTTAQMKFDQADIYYEKSNAAFEKIKALLADFKAGKY